MYAEDTHHPQPLIYILTIRFLAALRGWLEEDNMLGEDEEKDAFSWYEKRAPTSADVCHLL